MGYEMDSDMKAMIAVQLKVPCSGIPELDDMIRESRRLDMATAAMRDTTTPEWCLLKADALLAASGKEQKEMRRDELGPNSAIGKQMKEQMK